MNVTTDRHVIEVNEGDDVTLKCIYSTDTDTAFILNWYKTTTTVNDKPDISNGTKLWIYDTSVVVDTQTNATIDLMSSLVERNFDIPASMGHSIRMKNITLQDEGYYVCKLKLDFGFKQGMAYTKVIVHSK